jgi:hypothetical protein
MKGPDEKGISVCSSFGCEDVELKDGDHLAIQGNEQR